MVNCNSLELYYGLQYTRDFSFSIVDNLRELFTGKVKTSDLMGPVGISRAVTKTDSLVSFISLLTLISLSLGVTNLLPFPPLDGGKIVLLIIEWIRKKPLDEKYDNKACSIFILIFFFAYKICFILFIYCLVDLLKFRYLYVNNYRYDSKNKTIFGNFDFAHLALFVYYLTLIIFTYLNKVHLLIYFIIGAGITVVMFCSLIAINVVFAGLTAAIIFFEISVLLLTLKIAISKNKLDDKKFIDNMIIIDYYKYAVLMIISFIVLTIIIYMLYVICLCLNAICKRTPTSVDSDGNVYDQFNSKIGHFSTKPKYVDSDGNVYDKNHNKIKPDCNIF